MAWHGACDRTRLVDVSLLVALAILTAGAQLYLLAPDTLVSVDTASQYYPWYAFLGENLRAGAIPGWNPAVMVGYEANRLNVHTSGTATGLLVLSDVYYPAWKGYVDGQAASLYVADGALRAVPVPSGEHTVELRFESETLRAGMVISSAAVLGLAIGGLVCCRRLVRSTRSPRIGRQRLILRRLRMTFMPPQPVRRQRGR